MEKIRIVNAAEIRDIVAGHHDALGENTILLPDVSQHINNEADIEMVVDTSIIGMQVDEEPVIDLKSSQEECHQEDVLAEPLADAHKLLESDVIDIKPITDIIVKEEPKILDETEPPRKPGRRGRKPASEKIQRQSSPPPEPVRTRSRNLNKTPPAEVTEQPIKQSETKKVEKSKKIIKIELKDEIKEDEEKIDEDQCRICLSKDNLTSIFLFENVATIADKIMTICPAIKILEKDYLPQYICNTCLQSVNVAFNLKTLCETTDKQLRSKLKRSKNKVRRPTEFVLIDCKDITEDSEEDTQVKDDDEFHISNESGNSEPDTDSDSSYGVNKNKKKKRRTVRRRRSAGVRRRGRLPGSKNKKRTRQIRNNEIEKNSFDAVDQVVVIKGEGDESTDEESSPPKKIRSKKSKTEDGDTTPESRKKELPCVYCNQVFPSANALREHKKTHAGEKPFTCHICSKPFKLLGSFNSHLKRHKEEDDLMCNECEKHFPNKTEFRRHKVDVHGEAAAPFVCDKCKRAFTTKPRLDRHQETKCPGFEIATSTKKIKPEVDAINLGRDLFKCVAPMTTTYWSDSFSD